MSQEELQKKYDQLLEKVRRMRGHQKEYFKYRASSDLQLAKRFEREVDELIKKEMDQRKSNQKQFF
ncbi:MAG: hypothetical protein KAF40_00340 [Flavihumibacter sp.]|nr:hypothetical protein [Flavihumibacter sp.]